jgi:hypothetical protein
VTFTQSQEQCRKCSELHFLNLTGRPQRECSLSYQALSSRPGLGKRIRSKIPVFQFFFSIIFEIVDSIPTPNENAKVWETRRGDFQLTTKCGLVKLKETQKTRFCYTKTRRHTQKDPDVVDLLMASENFHGSCASIYLLWRCSLTYQVYIYLLSRCRESAWNNFCSCYLDVCPVLICISGFSPNHPLPPLSLSPPLISQFSLDSVKNKNLQLFSSAISRETNLFHNTKTFALKKKFQMPGGNKNAVTHTHTHTNYPCLPPLFLFYFIFKFFILLFLSSHLSVRWSVIVLFLFHFFISNNPK